MSGAVVERVVARDRLIVGGCAALVALLAWAWLWSESVSMNADASMVGMAMAGMDPLMASPSDVARYLPSAFVMWLLMMVAMMLPSAAPMIVAYEGLARLARAQGAAMASAGLFAAVYLAVWGVFSAVAAFAQWALVMSGAVSQMELVIGDRRVVGLLILAAGLYQATPLKRACLAGCRTPTTFLMRHWRAGRSGALRLGLVHGLYCLGCCVFLMALLFAFGVMNLAWVAALTAFVVVEKMAPFGERIGQVAGVAAIASGAWLAVAS